MTSESAQRLQGEIAAWVCLGHDEDLAAALRRRATLHGTRREAREERRQWPVHERPHVVPLVLRRRAEPLHSRRFRRVAKGAWTWIRCSGCGYVGEMVDVRRCTRCDDVLCSRKCCDEHSCRRRLPHEERPAQRVVSPTPVAPKQLQPHPTASPSGELHFTRYAEGAWLRIRCVACGYVGEMIDVFRCGLCDGILCGRACRDAHDCRLPHTGT